MIHPLAPISAAEIDALRLAVEKAGLGGEATRYSYVMLREPAKGDVLAARDDLPREVSALLTDLSTGAVTSVLADVSDVSSPALVATSVLDPAVDGVAPSLDEDFVLAEQIVLADPAYVAALAARGITDLSRVKVVALSAGVFGYADEVGIRACRALAFWQEYPTDSVWAHPIDGIVAHIDLTNKTILRLIDTGHLAIPAESGDYLDPAVRGDERTSLRPIEITQPDGVSFSLDGDVLSWEGWSVRLGFNGREGLTLHQLSFAGRPVLYRASVSEMVVNYGDPSPTHAWQNYFDVGEYQFGRLANSLELGCDCLGEIVYRNATVADDLGQVREIGNAICIHEEDFGVLWKHTDMFAGTKETRRQRRLVISFFVTVGNYDYGFYWYLYLDGKIELEAKATGIVFTSGHPGGDYPYATEIAPGLGAPVHQHLFCARLDTMVDGLANAVDEIDIARVPVSDTNPWGNALTRTITRLASEEDAAREADNRIGRVWRISSASTANRMGHAPAYVLHPEGKPLLMADPSSSAVARAAFATKSLWVTRYAPDELWAAGPVVNQHPGGAGLPAYASAGRDIDGEDIVVWHTFGLTHFPRLEDWPVMPVDYAGFTLAPDGFFDRNPTLDVPAVIGAADHCCAPGTSE
ncbi:primary-amine oxidase [Paractinoplanes durhamensis]|uniref:Amine oxidase n=1 Tax=Paractinoplanes durhamensis TaxID=113563 RepID=A0ABQ3YVP3_9ACTN|nr:primary-amine oxidase [Actinoplanes durhamensis]GIE01662.1 amine oxidase [Actinoplanes durhamensis]